MNTPVSFHVKSDPTQKQQLGCCHCSSVRSHPVCSQIFSAFRAWVRKMLWAKLLLLRLIAIYMFLSPTSFSFPDNIKVQLYLCSLTGNSFLNNAKLTFKLAPKQTFCNMSIRHVPVNESFYYKWCIIVSSLLIQREREREWNKLSMCRHHQQYSGYYSPYVKDTLTAASVPARHAP